MRNKNQFFIGVPVDTDGLVAIGWKWRSASDEFRTIGFGDPHEKSTSTCKDGGRNE
jgi:hypothetical protein